LILGIENLPDESLTRYYENIRQQAEADRAHKHHFTAGPPVREYADRLSDEMIKRRLQPLPIRWPS
jgi:hypothetical protein